MNNKKSFSSLEDAVFNSPNLKGPVEYIMQSGNLNELFNYQGEKFSLLHYLVILEVKEGVTMMLDLGADPNLKSSKGTSPLWTALIVKNLDIIQLLIERGADINEKDNTKFHNTPLLFALIEGLQDVAQLLKKNGADLDICNYFGVSPKNFESFRHLYNKYR